MTNPTIRERIRSILLRRGSDSVQRAKARRRELRSMLVCPETYGPKNHDMLVRQYELKKAMSDEERERIRVQDESMRRLFSAANIGGLQWNA